MLTVLLQASSQAITERTNFNDQYGSGRKGDAFSKIPDDIDLDPCKAGKFSIPTTQNSA